MEPRIVNLKILIKKDYAPIRGKKPTMVYNMVTGIYLTGTVSN